MGCPAQGRSADVRTLKEGLRPVHTRQQLRRCGRPDGAGTMVRQRIIKN
jgi:hypothetical protein